MFTRTNMLTVAVFFGLLGAGCGDSFKKAETTNTEQAYQQFIIEHPGSPQVPEAKRHIRELAFAAAGNTNTIEAWDGFLKRFGDAADSDEVKQANWKLEKEEFDVAIQSASVSTLEGVITKFPQSARLAAARVALENAKFAVAEKANTEAEYQNFIEK